MLPLLFLLALYADSCHSQYVYGGVVPRYAARRPVRRSALDRLESLERLRLPVTRYFPRVDTQVAVAPYPYQWTPGDLYALPPQWTDEFTQQLPQEEEDAPAAPEYVNYDYEPDFNAGYQRQASPYAEEVYPQEVDSEARDASVYNDLMSRYLMEEPQQPEMFDNVQRRSELTDGAAQLSRADEVRRTVASTNVTSTSSPLSAPVAQTTPPVQMTAVPSSPEKKDVKSLVVPDVLPVEQPQQGGDGQKEEPLFRPLQNSQKTTWANLPQLPRVKNSLHKSPIPLLKQMIQSGSPKAPVDPLLEELANLKKKPKV